MINAKNNPKLICEIVQNPAYVIHHTAMARGYVPKRKYPLGLIEEYHGKFGEGYKLYTHNPNSTQCCCLTYIVRENAYEEV